MRLGILKTGRPPSTCIPEFGTYPDMFKRLLGEDAYDYTVYAADEGELPASPKDCDAFLVTGSSAGAYEALPWIGPLKGFLNEAMGQAALVGICFGHQIMAEAFGGKVIKSPKGWGLGEQEYRVLKREPWMDDAASFRLTGSHQDQVVELPPGAEVIAASDFTPMGALAWRDQPAISMQLHPEFEPAYASALIENRRGARFSDAEADRALASYRLPDDRARVAGWLKNFLKSAT
jgi:GMP synthase-like glutamine amidotransferase